MGLYHEVVLRRTYDNQSCSVARSLEVVGERWTLLVVRDALTGVSRFSEFRRRLGVAASVLSVRLDRLVEMGVLERVPYQRHPTRYEYRLTCRGEELAPVVFCLMRWGDRHLAGDAVPPLTSSHTGCGGQVEARLVCGECAVQVAHDEITMRYNHD